MLLAFYFGASYSTDIFFFAISTISLFSAFLVTSLNITVVIPQAIDLRTRINDLAAMKLLNFFFGIYLLIGVFLASSYLIFPKAIIQFLSKFDDQIINDNVRIIYFTSPLCILIFATSHLNDVLIMHHYFVSGALLSILTNLFSIISIFLFHVNLGVSSIILGMVFGYFLYLLCQLFILQKKLRWNFFLYSFDLQKNMKRNILFSQSGYLFSNIAHYLANPILSGFGPGILSSYNFSYKIVNLFNSTLIAHFSNITGIKFNELFNL